MKSLCFQSSVVFKVRHDRWKHWLVTTEWEALCSHLCVRDTCSQSWASSPPRFLSALKVTALSTKSTQPDSRQFVAGKSVTQCAITSLKRVIFTNRKLTWVTKLHRHHEGRSQRKSFKYMLMSRCLIRKPNLRRCQQKSGFLTSVSDNEWGPQ